MLQKKHLESMTTLAMLASYMATIAVVIVDPTNKSLWGGLAFMSVIFMHFHLNNLPAPQNPYLGGLSSKERGDIVDAINS